MRWENDGRLSVDSNSDIFRLLCGVLESYVEMVFESRTVYGASFGMGALPNCIFPLVNLDDRRPEDISFDRAGIMRDDPGAGAFSN